jgi:hypothetical protein
MTQTLYPSIINNDYDTDCPLLTQQAEMQAGGLPVNISQIDAFRHHPFALPLRQSLHDVVRKSVVSYEGTFLCFQHGTSTVTFYSTETHILELRA